MLPYTSLSDGYLSKGALYGQFWGAYRADQIQMQLSLLHGCFPQIHDPTQSPWHPGGTGIAAHIFHVWNLRLGQDRELAKVRSGNYVFWLGGPLCLTIPCNSFFFFFFFVCVCVILRDARPASAFANSQERKSAEAGKTWLLKHAVRELMLQAVYKLSPRISKSTTSRMLLGKSFWNLNYLFSNWWHLSVIIRQLKKQTTWTHL